MLLFPRHLWTYAVPSPRPPDGCWYLEQEDVSCAAASTGVGGLVREAAVDCACDHAAAAKVALRIPAQHAPAIAGPRRSVVAVGCQEPWCVAQRTMGWRMYWCTAGGCTFTNFRRFFVPSPPPAACVVAGRRLSSSLGMLLDRPHLLSSAFVPCARMFTKYPWDT